MDCPACNGTTIEQMGMLGNLLWFRCRSCGLEFNMENNEDKTTEEADLKKFRELLLDAEIALTEAIGIMKKNEDVWSYESILSVHTLLLAQRTLGDALDKIDEGDYD